jgi:hypothetical protein
LTGDLTGVFFATPPFGASAFVFGDFAGVAFFAGVLGFAGAALAGVDLVEALVGVGAATGAA